MVGSVRGRRRSHAQIGPYLLELWGFSDTIVEALAHCRDPSACSGRENLALMALHAAFAGGSWKYRQGLRAALLCCRAWSRSERTRGIVPNGPQKG